jgi:hypothetical protein
MNRLQKFVEQGAYGETSGRVAYAFQSSLLPEPVNGMGWQTAQSFSVADELIKDAGLRDVFKAAVDKGYAVVSRGDERGEAEDRRPPPRRK